ncbi:hypothetical protein ACA910_021496 [Epithemia clementina (nom. ined.)]
MTCQEYFNDDEEEDEAMLCHHNRGRLRWGQVTIYEFPTILGNHPAVSDGGVPLTLAWNHENRTIVPIAFQEYIRQHLQNVDLDEMGRPSKATCSSTRQAPAVRFRRRGSLGVNHKGDFLPRTASELPTPRPVKFPTLNTLTPNKSVVRRIDAGTRLSCLLSMGYDLTQILKAVQEVEKIQQNRQSNLNRFVLEASIQSRGDSLNRPQFWGTAARWFFHRRAGGVLIRPTKKPFLESPSNLLYSSKALHSNQFLQLHRQQQQ